MDSATSLYGTVPAASDDSVSESDSPDEDCWLSLPLLSELLLRLRLRTRYKVQDAMHSSEARLADLPILTIKARHVTSWSLHSRILFQPRYYGQEAVLVDAYSAFIITVLGVINQKKD